MKNNDPKSLFRRLRAQPLLWNIVVILAIILALAIAAHILMQVGTRHGARRTVPDFAGFPIEKAREIARKYNLRIHVNDSLFVPAYDGGIILDQLPEGGVEVKPGRTVYVTINSFRQKIVDIPYVADRSLRQAKNMLEIAGLGIEKIVYRPDMATNYVLEEYFDGKPVTPQSRMQAEMGSGVVLHVGMAPGNTTTPVPQVVGYSLAQAKSRLWELGLNIGNVVFDPGVDLLRQKEARVYLQTPAAERVATLGSSVDLRLTLDEQKIAVRREEAEKQAAARTEERQRAERLRADSLEAIPETAIPEAERQSAESRSERSTDEGFFD